MDSLRRNRADLAAGLAEFSDLWSAETADALHQVLVLGSPFRTRTDAFEPFQLLEQHHRREPDTSIVTATLLLTDFRGRNGVGRLVREIEDGNILEPASLDLLAETFVAADEFVYWQVPDSWFAGASIEINLNDDTDPVFSPKNTDPDAGLAVAQRCVHPPLRRWASSRLARQDPTRWSQLFSRAREIERRGGAAIMSGLLDEIDAFAAPTQSLLIDAAVAWPNEAVRRLGFGLIADRDGPAVAYDKAHNDPNLRVRSWAQSLIEPRPVEGTEANAPTNPRTSARPSAATHEQTPLFP